MTCLTASHFIEMPVLRQESGWSGLYVFKESILPLVSMIFRSDFKNCSTNVALSVFHFITLQCIQNIQSNLINITCVSDFMGICGLRLHLQFQISYYLISSFMSNSGLRLFIFNLRFPIIYLISSSVDVLLLPVINFYAYVFFV